MTRALVGSLVVATLTGSFAWAADPPPPLSLRLEGDRVTIHATEVRPRLVLEALATAASAPLAGGVLHDDPLSIDADAEPVEAVLRRVLREQNFLVRYRRDGRPSGIELLGGPRAAAPAAVAVVAVSTTTSTTVIPRWGIPRGLGGRRAVPLPEPLAARLGADTVTLDEVIDVSLGYEDGSTRLLSHGVALSTLEHDRRIRRRFFDGLRRNPPDAGMLATPDGTRLLEMIEYLAVHSREPSLQHKASVIFDELRR